MSLSRDIQEENRKLARMRALVSEIDESLLESQALDVTHNATVAEFNRLFATAMKEAKSAPKVDASNISKRIGKK